MSKQTPSQTIGPFFAFGLTPEEYGTSAIVSNVLINNHTKGERIRIHGRVLDGEGEPVKDAMLEIWQADRNGRYQHPADQRKTDSDLKGFGRRGTDENGMYSFVTIKPGQLPGSGDTLQAPHINMIVFARGMLVHAYTRVYFSDEVEANEIDPILNTVESSRRQTLIAERDASHKISRYSFNIHLQGANETVFFDV